MSILEITMLMWLGFAPLLRSRGITSNPNPPSFLRARSKAVSPACRRQLDKSSAVLYRNRWRWSNCRRTGRNYQKSIPTLARVRRFFCEFSCRTINRRWMRAVSPSYMMAALHDELFFKLSINNYDFNIQRTLLAIFGFAFRFRRSWTIGSYLCRVAIINAVLPAWTKKHKTYFV